MHNWLIYSLYFYFTIFKCSFFLDMFVMHNYKRTNQLLSCYNYILTVRYSLVSFNFIIYTSSNTFILFALLFIIFIEIIITCTLYGNVVLTIVGLGPTIPRFWGIHHLYEVSILFPFYSFFIVISWHSIFVELGFISK